MSRGRYHADINAVRALVADGLSELHGTFGEFDQIWLNSARNRLKTIDEYLVAAAGGLAPWSRLGIGAVVSFGVVWAIATGCRAIGFSTGWVITSGLAVLIPVLSLVEWANTRLAKLLNRRRLARAPRPIRPFRVTVVTKGRLTEVPEALLLARVRLVSTILRETGSRRWRVSTLRFLAVEDRRRISRLTEADLRLCQSIDYLEIYLDGPARGRV
jgi:hypothetical protein